MTFVSVLLNSRTKIGLSDSHMTTPFIALQHRPDGDVRFNVHDPELYTSDGNNAQDGRSRRSRHDSGYSVSETVSERILIQVKLTGLLCPCPVLCSTWTAGLWYDLLYWGYQLS